MTPALPEPDDHIDAEGDTRATGHRNRRVITLLLVASFVVVLNETILGIAVPHLVLDLNVTIYASQWLTTAFLLTLAVVIPITGFIIQRFHTRSVYLAAMSVFTAGTIFAALAPGYPVLLAARVVQASGTAIMLPLLITTVLTLVPPATRGRVIGTVSIVLAVAPALGPTVSGIVLNYLGWRWLFIIVIPIAVTALVLGAKFMFNVSEPKPGRIDTPSVILSVLGFGGAVFGMSNLGVSQDPLATSIPLAVGIAAIAVFVVRQLMLQRRNSALLDLRPFTSLNFVMATLVVSVSMIALVGVSVVLPIYMLDVLHLDTLTTGLLLLPGGLLSGLLGPVAGRIYDRFGPTALMTTGALVVSSVLAAMTLLDENTPFWAVLVAHVSLCIGLAGLFTPLLTAGLASLPVDLYAHGGALFGTLQQLAASAGVALFITIMSSRAADLIAAGQPNEAAIAAGVKAAITFGAAISIVSIPAALLIRRPKVLIERPLVAH